MARVFTQSLVFQPIIPPVNQQGTHTKGNNGITKIIPNTKQAIAEVNEVKSPQIKKNIKNSGNLIFEIVISSNYYFMKDLY